MIKSIKITPRFHTREIINSTIRKDWFIFQAQAMVLGERAHKYIQNYVNKNRKRTGGTGNLASSINFHKEAGAGLGRIFWGVGDLSLLNAKAPEWYVVNYGKTVGGVKYIPNWGNFVPGRFSGGDGRPQASQAGKGRDSFNYAPNSGSGMFPKHSIRPMHYIQSTRAKVTRDIRILLTKLK